MIRIDIPPKGAVNGHVMLAAPSISDIGPILISGIGVSSILFEKLQAHGTNLVVDTRDGILLHVLARQENDGLDLTWKPTELDTSRVDEVQSRIKDKAFMIGKEAPPVQAAPPKAPDPAASPPHNEEEHLAKHLNRVP